MFFFRPLGPRCLLPDFQSGAAMGQVVLTRCSEWLRAARHPKTLFEQKPALSPLRPSRCFSELVSSLRAGEAQEGERESECAGGVKGGGRKKTPEDTLQQREGQEKYLIQTMNIVVSSHSLHSQSTSLGKRGEPRTAGLSAS